MRSAEQLGKSLFPYPRSRLKIWPRQTGLAVQSRVSLLILHTQAESGAFLTGFLPICAVASNCLIPSTAVELVPSLSGHTIAYRWRSLPRVHRRRAISPQGSSSNACCLFRHHHRPINARVSFPTSTIKSGTQDSSGHVCVCVFSSHSFWTSSSLDVPAGVTHEEGHTGFFCDRESRRYCC